MGLSSEDLMPFGKHKGRKMKNVPAGYLIWMYNYNKIYGEVKTYVKENLEELEQQFSKKKQ